MRSILTETVSGKGGNLDFLCWDRTLPSGLRRAVWEQAQHKKQAAESDLVLEVLSTHGGTIPGHVPVIPADLALLDRCLHD